MAWNQSQAPAETARRTAGRAGLVRLALMGLAACLVGGAAIWWTSSSGDTAAEEQAEKSQSARRLKHTKGARKSGREAVRDALPKNLPRKTGKKRKMRPPIELYAHLPAKERKLAEAVQNALDADDLDATIAATRASLASDNAEVRQNAVEALGWFGAAALPELTGCMADPDEDVRSAAASAWEQAVQELEKADAQFNVVMAAFGSLTDEDQLTTLGGILNGAALELIDGADDASIGAENRIAVVQKLVDVIEGQNEAAATAAKEAYSDITGNEWISFDEAERYVNDPEHYDQDAGENER